MSGDYSNAIFCGICQGFHSPRACVGRIEFGPAMPDTNPMPGATFRYTPQPTLEQKLDRIIELLERLVQQSPHE